MLLRERLLLCYFFYNDEIYFLNRELKGIFKIFVCVKYFIIVVGIVKYLENVLRYV